MLLWVQYFYTLLGEEGEMQAGGGLYERQLSKPLKFLCPITLLKSLSQVSSQMWAYVGMDITSLFVMIKETWKLSKCSSIIRKMTIL